MFKFFFLIKTKCFLIERNCKQCFDGIVFLSEIVVNRIVSIVINKIIIIIIKKFKIIIIISIIIIILLAQKVKYPTSRAEFLSLTCVSGDFWSVFLFVVRKVRAKAVRKINRGLTRKRWEGERGETEKRSEFFPWLLSMAPPRSFFSSTLGKVLRVLRAGDDRMDQTVQKLAPKKSDIEFPSLDKFGCTFLGRTTRPRYTGTNTNLHIVLNTLPHPLQKKPVLE